MDSETIEDWLAVRRRLPASHDLRELGRLPALWAPRIRVRVEVGLRAGPAAVLTDEVECQRRAHDADA